MPINFGPGNLVPDPESWFKLLFLLIGYQLDLSAHFTNGNQYKLLPPQIDRNWNLGYVDRPTELEAFTNYTFLSLRLNSTLVVFSVNFI